MSDQVTVIAKMRAKPGMEARLRQVLLDLCGPTRVEAGCINYDLHQSPDNPGEFLFHENWVSTAAVAEHLKSAHVEAAFAQAGEILDAAPEITQWKRVALAQTARL